MEELKFEYKGVKIEYHEYRNNWSVSIGDSILAKDVVSLSAAREVADKHSKKERTFKEVEAWKEMSGWDSRGWTKVRVTSKSEGENNYWIFVNGKRSKEEARTLFAITPENEKLINEIREADKEIEKIKQEKESKGNQLTPFKT